MKKIICDYCGTLYDPEVGKCPICGAQAEGYEEKKDPAPEEEAELKNVPQPEPEQKNAPKAEPEEEEEDSLLSAFFGDENDDPEEEPEETPEEPEAPAEPAEPETPAAPETPEEPAKPETPAAPEEPEAPKTPALGDTQKVPDKLSDLPKAKTRTPEPEETPIPASDEEIEDVDTFLADLKRLLDEPESAPEEDEKLPEALAVPAKKKKQKSSKGVRVACAILAVLVVLFAVYIGWRFARPYIMKDQPAQTLATDPADTKPSEEAQNKSCTGIKAEKEVVLTAVGEEHDLVVELEPADTDDSLIFVSEDSSIAMVSTSGKITAVAPGTTYISISCGNVSASCAVVCDFEAEETEPTEPATEPDPYANLGYNPVMNHLSLENDLHLTSKNFEITVTMDGRTGYMNNDPDTVVEAKSDEGVHLRLRNKTADGKRLDVKWEVEDESILTMDWNEIEPHSVGTTLITGVYDDETYHIIVHIVE